MSELKKKKKHSSKKHKSKSITQEDNEIDNEINSFDDNNNLDSSKAKKKKKENKEKSLLQNNSNNDSNKKEKKNKDKSKKKDEISNDIDSSLKKENKKKRKYALIEEKNKENKKKKNKKKSKSKDIIEVEEEDDEIEKGDNEVKEIEENEEDNVKRLRNEIKKIKAMESQKEIDEFTDIDKEEEIELEEDMDNESLIIDENEIPKESLKFNDWENMTNEEFNEKIKSLPKKKFKILYTNYLLSLKPILFQLSSHYLSDTNYLLGLVQKYKNSKTSLATKYNKFSAWPLPFSEQVPLPFRSYDIFTNEEDMKNEETTLYKKAIDNDIYFSDLLKEETKAYINEYWKKIHHQERYEYEELKKFEEKEKEQLNKNNSDDIMFIDDENEIDRADNENNTFSLLSDEKVTIIQLSCLNKLIKVIDEMITEQSFIIRYKKSLPDVIGINNAGNIIAHAINVGIPLKIIRSTFNRISNLIEEDRGNHSIYKKLSEFIKILEKKEEKEKQENLKAFEANRNNENEEKYNDSEIESDDNNDSDNEIDDNMNHKRLNSNKNDDDINDENQNDLEDLKKLAGKYTLLKFGNSLKQIKVKKNLENYIKNNNVLNLYTFK